MKIKKILILGSTHLTKLTCDLLSDYYDLVGYVSADRHPLTTKMNLPKVTGDVKHDIKLSIQYTEKVLNVEKSFNIHTGLLPKWGGCDILYHTIKDRSDNYTFEQGMTFHKMTNKFDYGPIISKITYPVFESDTMEDLYNKIEACLPSFSLSSIKLLETINENKINECYSEKPRIFKRGEINPADSKMYSKTLVNLKNKIK